MNKAQAKLLLWRYNQGATTDVENSIIEGFFNQISSSEIAPNPEGTLYISEKTWDRFIHQRKLKLKLSMASAAIIFLSFGVWLFNKQVREEPVALIKFTNDVVPGKNRASIRFDDGESINLSEAKNGLAIGEKMKYTDGTTVSSSFFEAHKNASTITASTPTGGNYQFILPDGSKVWLNAESMIKFPSNFKGLKNRTIELNGEAYFEVSKDKNTPFIVLSKFQKVNVLGTHFNINSYDDEPGTKTTVLEGYIFIRSLVANPSGSPDKVYLKRETLLKPDQQSIIINGTTGIREVDAESVIQWKNGEFVFISEPLEDIMKKISRWYGVNVIYKNETAKKELISGSIENLKNLSSVLAMLGTVGGVAFEIDDRKVIVSKL